MAKGNTGLRGNGRATANGAAATVLLEPFLKTGHKMLEAWAAIGSELISFGASRFERGVETSQAMAQSSSAREALELQAKFAQSMAIELLSETRKLTEMSTRPVIESLSVAQKATRNLAPVREAAR